MNASQEIIAGMQPWLEDRKAPDIKSRTPNQKGWDSAVLTVAEYVRRRMHYDEELALEIHNLLSTHLP